MKILYAIQGTGNGHLSRAREIIPILKKKGDVDLVMSGTQVDVKIDHPIKFRYNGLGFIFGKKGGVDIVQTILKSRFFKFVSEIKSLPVKEYDLVLNDFEPVTAWACKLAGVNCIGVSHQSAVLHPKAPKPKKNDLLGQLILKYYAPVNKYYGFHFDSFASNIFTPVIRSEIRFKTPKNNGHYTVYLPAFSDEYMLKFFKNFPEVEWQIFSKHNKQAIEEGNVKIWPVNNEDFVESMLTSEGIFCGAGFEAPAEALYLGKKLMVVPMSNQYEQHCNAAALKSMGIPVIPALKPKYIGEIKDWINKQNAVKVDYRDNTEMILDEIIENNSAPYYFVPSFLWESEDQPIQFNKL